MTPKLLMTSALLACAMLAITAVDAAARGWGHRGGHGGAFGHYYARSFHAPGWSHSASINRSPGRVTGTRSFQTPGGRGATRNFSRGCSGATCDRSSTTTTNSGKTWSRLGHDDALRHRHGEPEPDHDRTQRRHHDAHRQLHVRGGLQQSAGFDGPGGQTPGGGSHDDAERRRHRSSHRDDHRARRHQDAIVRRRRSEAGVYCQPAGRPEKAMSAAAQLRRRTDPAARR